MAKKLYKLMLKIRDELPITNIQEFKASNWSRAQDEAKVRKLQAQNEDKAYRIVLLAEIPE